MEKAKVQVSEKQVLWDKATALIEIYRKLKANSDTLAEQMSAIKVELEPVVEAIGEKWTDPHGYARFVEQKAGFTCDAGAVHTQAEIWRASTDPIMQSCGATILQHIKPKQAKRYLQVS